MQRVIRFVISAISVIKLNLVMQLQLHLALAAFGAYSCFFFRICKIVLVTNSGTGVGQSIVIIVPPQ